MFLLSILFIGALGSEKVKISVEQGVLEGEILVPSTKIGTYWSFKGIPYAKPPLGNLRFQAPQPPQKWKGVRKATQHGPVCIQKSAVLSDLIIGSEDCLYLNVYKPNTDTTKLMPVMFFIHGGYFVSGSGNSDLYSPDFLVGFGVIVVTINYRLDALGFLAVDIERAPGNAGLKDQVAALKWVQRNIKSFGGDPDKVTIFGQSVGGVSVTLHMVSPAARGLFNRAIPMSGTLLNHFALNVEHVTRAFNTGMQLGCYTNDPDELIDCLINVPAEKLLQIRPNIYFSDKITQSVLTGSLYFGPIIEKKLCDDQYLTEQPRDLVRRGTFNDVDMMIGYTENEGIYPVTLFQSSKLKLYTVYKELYVPVAITYVKNQRGVLDLGKKIENYYFGSETVKLTTIRNFLQYYSWSSFNFDIHDFMDHFLPKDSTKSRYFYIFSLYSTRNVFSKLGAQWYGVYQATHLDDLPYLFDGIGYNITLDLNSEAYVYIKKMCRLFTNFAKYGTPTSDNYFGIIWPNYNDNMEYVKIDKTLTVGTVKYNRQLEFWRYIYKQADVEQYIG